MHALRSLQVKSKLSYAAPTLLLLTLAACGGSSDPSTPNTTTPIAPLPPTASTPNNTPIMPPAPGAGTPSHPSIPGSAPFTPTTPRSTEEEIHEQTTSRSASTSDTPSVNEMQARVAQEREQLNYQRAIHSNPFGGVGFLNRQQPHISMLDVTTRRRIIQTHTQRYLAVHILEYRNPTQFLSPDSTIVLNAAQLNATTQAFEQPGLTPVGCIQISANLPANHTLLPTEADVTALIALIERYQPGTNATNHDSATNLERPINLSFNTRSITAQELQQDHQYGDCGAGTAVTSSCQLPSAAAEVQPHTHGWYSPRDAATGLATQATLYFNTAFSDDHASAQFICNTILGGEFRPAARDSADVD